MGAGFKWAATLCLLIVAGASHAQSLQPQKPTVRLPAIVHKWGESGDSTRPEITIEEISKCIGDDVGIRGKVTGLERQQAKLEAELAQLNGQSAELEQLSAAILEQKTRFEQSVQTFQAGGTAFDARRAQIEQLQGNQKLTPEEAKKGNELIARYNADLAKRNEQRDRLLASEKALRLRLDVYNDGARAINERATAFNARNTTFNAEAEAFNGELASYKERCVGERAIKHAIP